MLFLYKKISKKFPLYSLEYIWVLYTYNPYCLSLIVVLFRSSLSNITLVPYTLLLILGNYIC